MRIFSLPPIAIYFAKRNKTWQTKIPCYESLTCPLSDRLLQRATKVIPHLSSGLKIERSIFVLWTYAVCVSKMRGNPARLRWKTTLVVAAISSCRLQQWLAAIDVAIFFFSECSEEMPIRRYATMNWCAACTCISVIPREMINTWNGKKQLFGYVPCPANDHTCCLGN